MKTVQIWVVVLADSDQINQTFTTYQTRQRAFGRSIKSGDLVLFSYKGRVYGKAFVNGEPNMWDNTVLNLADYKRVPPFKTPIRPWAAIVPLRRPLPKEARNALV